MTLKKEGGEGGLGRMVGEEKEKEEVFENNVIIKRSSAGVGRAYWSIKTKSFSNMEIDTDYYFIKDGFIIFTGRGIAENVDANTYKTELIKL